MTQDGHPESGATRGLLNSDDTAPVDPWELVYELKGELNEVRDQVAGLRRDTPNGGRFTRFLRQWQPWLMAFLVPAVLAMSVYLPKHYFQHREIPTDHSDQHKQAASFMKHGGRVYSSTGEPMSTAQLMREIDAHIDARVPPPEVTRALDDLSGQLAQLRTEVRDNGRQISRMEGSLGALVVKLNGS